MKKIYFDWNIFVSLVEKRYSEDKSSNLLKSNRNNLFYYSAIHVYEMQNINESNPKKKLEIYLWERLPAAIN